ncbi:MAG: choice-of-anchor D domain-containing protein [Candidatus Kapabacteria bacterium]|nr:choice-of-anchor D domain-containing protein [Candidatus Kapabacteria bacterium]
MSNIKLILVIALSALFTVSSYANYCIPPKFKSGPYTAIKSINLGNINYTSKLNDGYGDFSGTVPATNLVPGSSQTIYFSFYYDPSMVSMFTGNLNVRVWIDYNQDSTFSEPSEIAVSMVVNCKSVTLANPYINANAIITVPANAKNGPTRMRVYEDMDVPDGHILPNPCGYLNSNNYLGQHGECEDYTVVVNQSSHFAYISSDSSSLNFGTVKIQNSASATINLKNTGDTLLNLNSIKLKDSSDSSFTIDNSVPLPVTLNPNMNYPVKIKFTPKNNSVYSNSLIILSDGANKSFEIPMSGTGSNATSNISLNYTDYDYGKILISKNSTKLFKLSNNGNFPLKVDSIKLLNNLDNVFQIGNIATPFTIANAQFQNFTISFLPTSSKVYNSKIQVFSDADNIKVLEMTLKGEGTLTNVNDENNFDLYPNPAEDFISLNIPLNQELSVLNFDGIEILKTIYTGKLNVRTIAKGIYFIKTNGTILKFQVCR